MRRVTLTLHRSAWRVLFGQAVVAWMQVAAALVLVLSLGALTVSVWRYAQSQFAVQAAQLVIDAAETEIAQAKPTAEAMTPISAQRLTALARMTRHLNTPWPGILDALERHASNDIALLSIEPDAVRGRVRLAFEARKLQPLIDFAQRLGDSEVFSRVEILRHEVNERDPAHPYRMALDVVLADNGNRPAAGKL